MKQPNTFFGKGEPQRKRMMWFRGQYVPILYSGRSRKDKFGSEVWVARDTTQKIGAIIVALVFLCGSMALFVASPMIRSQIVKDTGGTLGQIFGAGLAVLAFLAAGFMLLLTFRLVRGVVRSFQR